MNYTCYSYEEFANSINIHRKEKSSTNTKNHRQKALSDIRPRFHLQSANGVREGKLVWLILVKYRYIPRCCIGASCFRCSRDRVSREEDRVSRQFQTATAAERIVDSFRAIRRWRCVVWGIGGRGENTGGSRTNMALNMFAELAVSQAAVKNPGETTVRISSWIVSELLVGGPRSEKNGLWKWTGCEASAPSTWLIFFPLSSLSDRMSASGHSTVRYELLRGRYWHFLRCVEIVWMPQSADGNLLCGSDNWVARKNYEYTLVSENMRMLFSGRWSKLWK